MPRTTAVRGGKLVIVNLQKTPLTAKATLHIHAKTDFVMESLMHKLQIPIPDFRLERRVIFGMDGTEMFAKAVDVHAPDQEIGVLCAVDWDGSIKAVPEIQRVQAVWKSLAHRRPLAGVDVSQLAPTLHFVGHYQEPPLTLQINLTHGDQDVRLTFDPCSGQWDAPAISTINEGAVAIAADDVVDRDPEYGVSHRTYVISKRQEQGVENAAEQVDREFEDARRHSERFGDADTRDRARNRACSILKNHKEIGALLESVRAGMSWFKLSA